jgi:hypothetical protein
MRLMCKSPLLASGIATDRHRIWHFSIPVLDPIPIHAETKSIEGRQVADIEFHYSSFVVLGGAHDRNRRSYSDKAH